MYEDFITRYRCATRRNFASFPPTSRICLGNWRSETKCLTGTFRKPCVALGAAFLKGLGRTGEQFPVRGAVVVLAPLVLLAIPRHARGHSVVFVLLLSGRPCGRHTVLGHGHAGLRFLAKEKALRGTEGPCKSVQLCCYCVLFFLIRCIP